MYVNLGDPSKENREEKIEIHSYDANNVDVTLAHIIAPLLMQLKEVRRGAPFVDSDDVPIKLQMTDEELTEFTAEGNTDTKWFDRWDYIIGEMIFAFQSKLEDWDEQFKSGEDDLNFVKITDKKYENDEELYTLVHGPNHTRKYDVKEIEKYQARMTNGFRLFGKYYESLWD